MALAALGKSESQAITAGKPRSKRYNGPTAFIMAILTPPCTCRPRQIIGQPADPDGYVRVPLVGLTRKETPRLTAIATAASATRIGSEP